MCISVSRCKFRVAAASGAAALLLSAAPAAAQNEAALKSFFEGTRVTLRMDLPGSEDGVNLRVDGKSPIDYPAYRDDLKKYGIAIHAGESVPVTLVKVKKDNIEFQLAGGGFGTFGDDTSTTVYLPLVDKSEREKTLERLVREEDDRDKRRAFQRELDELREHRERENARITAEKLRLEDAKRVRIADERRRGGSRFNLRYSDRVPANITPQDLMAVLAEYVDFGGAPRPPTGAPLPQPMPPPAAASVNLDLLRKGMSRADAERAFGRPIASSVHRDGNLDVTTLTFGAGDKQISADFVEEVLVRYTISSR